MKSFFIGNIEIKTPVIQGGMGVGISLSGLASAVANEGGVGVISCAGLGLLYPKGKGTYPEKCINGLKEEIRKARAKTKGIFRCRASTRPAFISDSGEYNQASAYCIFFTSSQNHLR